MAFVDLRAFVRANLPEPPARVLEVGAGAGDLARALRAGGYDVLAIDPKSDSDDVRAVALADLDEAAGAFAAAVAVVSLHHVDPLEDSCRRLGELVEPGGTLLIDEFDVAAFDLGAASWWLEQRGALGEPQPKTAEELVREHREHLHPLERILGALEPDFELGPPLRGPWLHRWNLGESLRAVEEEAIARGRLRATGARLVAHRRGRGGSMKAAITRVAVVFGVAVLAAVVATTAFAGHKHHRHHARHTAAARTSGTMCNVGSGPETPKGVSGLDVEPPATKSFTVDIGAFRKRCGQLGGQRLEKRSQVTRVCAKRSREKIETARLHAAEASEFPAQALCAVVDRPGVVSHKTHPRDDSHGANHHVGWAVFRERPLTAVCSSVSLC